jgi:Zn-finger nucleic acid-binding protein
MQDSSSAGGNASEALPCPGCGAQLTISTTAGKRRYLCAACGGVVCGMAVLRDFAGAEPAQHLWTSAIVSDADGEERCPFCFAHMHTAGVEHGHAAICKTCEMVWLDKDALSTMTPGTSAQQGQAAADGVSKCPNCGAPVAHSWDEKCTYCGAALSPATKVIVIEGDPAETRARYAGPGHLSGWELAADVVRRIQDD